MDISTMLPAAQASGPSPASGPHAAGPSPVAAASFSAPATTPTHSTTPAVPADTLSQAVDKLNRQLAQNGAVKLTAGLDTGGSHPGQVLVELSDKLTQQVYFKYYVPATQVIQASEHADLGNNAKTGALLSAKA